MKGLRKKFKIFISSCPGSKVWHCYGYFERQFGAAFFKVVLYQTPEPCQKYFFEAIIWIEVSKVSKQLQAKQTADDVAIDCK